MYQNVNYNQPPQPTNPFDSTAGNYGAYPAYQPNFAPGYQHAPPAYNYNPAPAPQFVPNMNQPMLQEGHSMNGGKISPIFDEQIRSTLCWDIVLNSLSVVFIAVPCMVSLYGFLFSIWFFYVWVCSILAQRRYASALMPTFDKRRAMDSYAGTRNCHMIVLWAIWGVCLGLYLYVIIIISIFMSMGSRTRDSPNVIATLIFMGVSLVLVGQATYISKTQKHIILASVQA